MDRPLFEHITGEDATRILGLKKSVPMTPEAMAAGLRVTFFPVRQASEPVREFTARLRDAFAGAGVTVLPFEEAMDPVRPRKVREHVIIVAAGELADGDLPVDRVQNLRTTTIVGIVDGPCPAREETADQEKLNSIVRTLTWSIVQVAIYVEPDRWTITTMNGAVIPCPSDGPMQEEVLQLLVPKLAAPVVPPHASDFETHPGVLDLDDPRLRPYIEDFVRSGPLWERTGLLLYHTSMEELEFRNPFYKRIAAAYLDHRSGMSYGFLARQTADSYRPFWLENGEEEEEIALSVAGTVHRFPVPGAWVLTTRSGCDKSHINPATDLLMMGLHRGRIIIATPPGLKVDSKPSYDTLTILAHALGNRLVSALLDRLRPGSAYSAMLATQGAACAHWHGHIPAGILPPGCALYGTENPPVSCSTHQAALFALTGKLGALERSLERGEAFEGDCHVEPHHGVNVTGPTLLRLARWALDHVVGSDPRRPVRSFLQESEG